MIEIEQQALFDYDSLDTDTRVFVQEKAQSIHTRLKRTAEDVIAIGQDLIAVKKRLEQTNNFKRGLFLVWIKFEFDMSRMSAVRFMQVAERFGECNKLLHNYAPSVLYALAAPSTPDEVFDMVESGQIAPTVPAIREAKREIQEEQHQQNEEETFNARRKALEEEGFYYIPEQKLVFDAIDAGIIRIDVEEDEEEDENEQRELKEIAEAHKGSQSVVTPNLDKIDLLQKDVADLKYIAKEQRDAHVMNVMGSSDSPEWYTPQVVINLVCKMFGSVDTDPCSNSHDAPSIPAQMLYTKDDDGLSHEWRGKTYLNPPYGAEIGKWTNKLIDEYECGNVSDAIALLPARIDTVWFQPLYAYPMCNVRGRIQFANSPYSAPFPCVIVYIGKNIERFIEVFKSMGPIMRRIA